MHLRRAFRLMVTVALGLFWGMNAEPHLAKQGTYAGKFGWYAIGKTLEIENDHLLCGGEFNGTAFNDTGSGFLHGTSFVCPGMNDILQGVSLAALCAALRYWIHPGGVGGEAPRPLARGIERFQGWMQRHNIDPDRDYGRFSEHYFLKLPPEHLELLDEELIRTLAIVGSPEECLERIRALAQAGGTDFALILGGNAHELMRRFSQAVIAHW